MYSTNVCTRNGAATPLSSLFTDRPDERHATAAGVLRRWVAEHLSRSNPNLGRKGAVCPFTGSAMKKDLIRVAYLDGRDLDRGTIADALTVVVDEFRSAPSADAQDRILETALLVFPDLTDTDVVDEVQLHFKNLFVEYDLMIGQFYPGCAEPGLWNREFRPLDAPFAMIAIRQMTSSDYPFLAGQEDWAAAYLRKFAPSIPARVRNDIAMKLAGYAASA